MKLAEYANQKEAHGRLYFTKEEAMFSLGSSSSAFKSALNRLIQKKRLAILKPGSDLIFILPVVWQSHGVLPPHWIADPLMKHLGIPYYIGLLSAAERYGAAHQRPQTFQILIPQRLNRIRNNMLQVDFYQNAQLSEIPTQELMVETGKAIYSTPEATALDLVKYYRHCGYWSNVATVFSELHESLDQKKLMDLIQRNVYEPSVIQRFGFLMSLEEVEGSYLVEELKNRIQKDKPRVIPLQSGQKYDRSQINKDWRIYINEVIEVDV